MSIFSNFFKKEAPLLGLQGSGGGLGFLAGGSGGPQVEASGGASWDAGGYRFHAFINPGNSSSTRSGTLTVTTGGEVEVFMVAGGGGGQGTGGGGGGAGGAKTIPYNLADSTPVPISVGEGGGNNVPGQNTTFGTENVIGGGAGGGWSGENGDPGGSGGGGGRYGTPGGNGISGQGYGGGSGRLRNDPGGNGGGGGGAGGAGESAPNSRGGNGGPGVACPFGTDIPGTYGVPGPTPGRWFAGGGGGGSHQQGDGQGTGGAGGGGNGESAGCPGVGNHTTVQNNTGSGSGGTGGGGNQCPGSSVHQAGGGIVIVRYSI